MFLRLSDHLSNIAHSRKVTAIQHAGRFNTPSINQVVIVIVGDQLEQRYIKIMFRDNTVQTIHVISWLKLKHITLYKSNETN